MELVEGFPCSRRICGPREEFAVEDGRLGPLQAETAFTALATWHKSLTGTHEGLHDTIQPLIRYLEHDDVCQCVSATTGPTYFVEQYEDAIGCTVTRNFTFLTLLHYSKSTHLPCMGLSCCLAGPCTGITGILCTTQSVTTQSMDCALSRSPPLQMSKCSRSLPSALSATAMCLSCR